MRTFTVCIVGLIVALATYLLLSSETPGPTRAHRAAVDVQSDSEPYAATPSSADIDRDRVSLPPGAKYSDGVLQVRVRNPHAVTLPPVLRVAIHSWEAPNSRSFSSPANSSGETLISHELAGMPAVVAIYDGDARLCAATVVLQRRTEITLTIPKYAPAESLTRILPVGFGDSSEERISKAEVWVYDSDLLHPSAPSWRRLDPSDIRVDSRCLEVSHQGLLYCRIATSMGRMAEGFRQPERRASGVALWRPSLQQPLVIHNRTSADVLLACGPVSRGMRGTFITGPEFALQPAASFSVAAAPYSLQCETSATFVLPSDSDIAPHRRRLATLPPEGRVYIDTGKTGASSCVLEISGAIARSDIVVGLEHRLADMRKPSDPPAQYAPVMTASVHGIAKAAMVSPTPRARLSVASDIYAQHSLGVYARTVMGYVRLGSFSTTLASNRWHLNSLQCVQFRDGPPFGTILLQRRYAPSLEETPSSGSVMHDVGMLLLDEVGAGICAMPTGRDYRAIHVQPSTSTLDIRREVWFAPRPMQSSVVSLSRMVNTSATIHIEWQGPALSSAEQSRVSTSALQSGNLLRLQYTEEGGAGQTVLGCRFKAGGRVVYNVPTLVRAGTPLVFSALSDSDLVVYPAHPLSALPEGAQGQATLAAGTIKDGDPNFVFAELTASKGGLLRLSPLRRQDLQQLVSGPVIRMTTSDFERASVKLEAKQGQTVYHVQRQETQYRIVVNSAGPAMRFPISVRVVDDAGAEVLRTSLARDARVWIDKKLLSMQWEVEFSDQRWVSAVPNVAPSNRAVLRLSCP